MNKTTRLLLLSATALALLVVACSGSDPTSTPAPTATPVPTATVPPSPTATPKPTATPSATATPEPTLATDLFLEVITPEDGSVVSQETIVIEGITTPDAVVSIDGETIGVNAQGEFSVEVSLQEGPNIIEVAASNLTGEQESTLLSVFYIL